MARLGMDVDVVETVAADLDRRATDLERVRSEVARQVGAAHGRGLWTGGRADRYVADWRGSDARVRGLVRALHEFARQLRQQVQQQRQASEASGGSATPGAAGSSLTPDPRPSGPSSLFEVGLTGFGALAAVTTTYGGMPYPKLYKQWFGGFDFMHYNRTLQGTYSPLMARIAESPGMKALGYFGDGLSLYGAGNDLHHAYSDPRATGGDQAVASGYAVGALLKVGGQESKCPPLYLAGVATSAWTMVGDEARKVDWSPGAMSDTWTYIQGNPGVVVEEGWKATRDMFTTKIWKIL